MFSPLPETTGSEERERVPPTIIVRRLPGLPGVVLAVLLLLAGQREIEVDVRPGPLAWLAFRLAVGPALLLTALFAAGIAVGIVLGRHGLSAFYSESTMKPAVVTCRAM